MSWIKNLGRRLRGLKKDEQGDEGVSKMLILLLVTVPIVLVLVIFGGKIMDEFQVGLCGLGIIDAPQWHVDTQTFDENNSLEDRKWTDEECGYYRLDDGEAPRPLDSEE